MVLVDTSIWVAHLREGNSHLEKLLMGCEVVCHPFIIAELACGNLKNRSEILSLLQALPKAPALENEEILYFIEQNSLMGKGIGLVDMHLLASARLARIPLWSSDKKLSAAASKLAITYR